MGSKAWSHYRGSRLALYTNPPSVDERWRLHHSRSNDPLAWINPVSLRIYRFHYDGMPPSESVLNFRNSVFIAISMEPCLRPLAVFHLWTRLDCQMERLSNKFLSWFTEVLNYIPATTRPAFELEGADSWPKIGAEPFHVHTHLTLSRICISFG